MATLDYTSQNILDTYCFLKAYFNKIFLNLKITYGALITCLNYMIINSYYNLVSLYGLFKIKLMNYLQIHKINLIDSLQNPFMAYKLCQPYIHLNYLTGHPSKKLSVRIIKSQLKAVIKPA